jgi:hypothetical protein
VVLVTAAAPVVWGSTYLVTTELLPDGRPLLAAAARALPAGLLLLLVTRELPTGAWWWRSVVLGTLNIGAFFALLFVSAYRLPGGVAALLGAAGPLLVAGLSALLLGEQLSARRLLAGVLAAAGVGLTVITSAAALDPVGVLAGIGGAASMSLGIVLTKRWPRPTSVLTMTSWQLTAGGLLLLPLALSVEGTPAALSMTTSPATPTSPSWAAPWRTRCGSAASTGCRPSRSRCSVRCPPGGRPARLGGARPAADGLQLLGAAVALGGVVAGQRLSSATPRPPTPTDGARQPAGPVQWSAPQRDVHGRLIVRGYGPTRPTPGGAGRFARHAVRRAGRGAAKTPTERVQEGLLRDRGVGVLTWDRERARTSFSEVNP